ncbi:MAG: T9SS type A sorting domain-containing protein [Bacteroidia bacterium]|nr:MAG: T9SS type A sorting domain-containing protein [Bacteroidia bacterium]
MKKNLLLGIFLLTAALLNGQQLVVGSADVVPLYEYPNSSYLVEAGADAFYWIGSTNSTSTGHPELTEINSDYGFIYFLKYDRNGTVQFSNTIQANTYSMDVQNAFAFNGGLTVAALSRSDVNVSGNTIPLDAADEMEFIATYDPGCKLQKFRKIWNLTYSQYVYSEFIMDPADGSVYVFGAAYEPMELIDYGILGKDFSGDYFYVIKYNYNLELDWVYEAGFDMNASGTSPYYNRINVHPGNQGELLITGTYRSESAPLIMGRTLPPYTDSFGTFSVLLDGAGNPIWVQDGSMNGFGYATEQFEGFPMPNGDFVVAGITTTGYFQLGEMVVSFPDGMNYANHFVYRMDHSGKPIWTATFHSMGKANEEKKSAQSDAFRDNFPHDAINWKNKRLYMTGFFGRGNDPFTVAGRPLDHEFADGIFVAAIDLDTGDELWGYSVTSDNADILGFDMDRTGNVSLMGANQNNQDMEGINELAVDASSFVFHVGLDYNGKALWYNNANLLNGPYFYNLYGMDMEVLPNGETFTSLKLNEANDLVIGGSVMNSQQNPYSNWLVELAPDMVLGGLVTDALGTPVYPGMVKAFKSTPWGGYPVVDSSLIEDDGSFQFTHLYPGNYRLQAMTNLVQYPNGIPSYYGNNVRWQNAQFVDITPDFNTNTTNILLSEIPKFTSMDGSGELSGTISTEEGTFLKGTMAQPSKRTGVILLGKSKKSTMAGEVVAYVETDEMGMFVFDNVPDGEYILVVDVAGLEMLSTHEVTIAGNQIVSGLNYTVSNEGIYAGWPSAVSYLENKTLNIWPNPGEGLIMMDLPSAGDYSVRIYTADGRLIRTEDFRSAGGVVTLDITGEYKGLYILKMEGPETNTTRKYIKK